LNYYTMTFINKITFIDRNETLYNENSLKNIIVIFNSKIN
jgi:hypothetical protein